MAGTIMAKQFISDEDMSKMEPPKKAFVSDEDMSKMESNPRQGNGLLNFIGDKYNRYVTAPARAGVASMQEGNLGFEAWKKQLGEDPKKAPTGKDVALKAGVDDTSVGQKSKSDVEWEQNYLKEHANAPDIEDFKKSNPTFGQDIKYGSKADAAGGFLNMAIDPTLPLMSGKVTGLLGRAGRVAETAGNLISKGTQGLEESKTPLSIGGPKSAAEVTPGMYEHTPASNADQIKASANRLGVEPTPGMTTSNPNVKVLENTLGKNPTIAGNMTRQQYAPINSAISENLKGVGEVSPITPNEAGQQMQTGLMGKIAERLDPLKASYEDIRNSTRGAPVNEADASRISSRLSASDFNKVPGTDAQAVIGKYSKMLNDAKDVQSVGLISSQAKQELRAAQATGNTVVQPALNQAIDAAEKLQRRGMLRAGAEGAGEEGVAQAKNLLGQIKDTNKGFRQLSQDVGAATNTLPTRASSPGDVLNQVDRLTPEVLSKNMFNVNDVNSLKALKNFSPETFEVARQQRVSQLLQQYTTKGKLNTGSFLKAVSKIPSDAQELLFPQGVPSKIKDAETLFNSIPENFNTSNTASGEAWKYAIDPRNIPQQISDYGKYRLLQNKGLIPTPPVTPISKGLMRAGKAGQVQMPENK